MLSRIELLFYVTSIFIYLIRIIAPSFAAKY